MLDQIQEPGSFPWCQHQRQLGNFEESIAILNTMDPTDSMIAPELQRAYMEQGYLAKAADCVLPFLDLNSSSHDRLHEAVMQLNLAAEGSAHHRLISAEGALLTKNTPVAHCLAKLISRYLNCFVSGKWEEALEEAEFVFETYLRDWEMPSSSTESPLLLVSLSHRHLSIRSSKCLDFEERQCHIFEGTLLCSSIK
jgi:hypothetical protein